MRPDDNFNKKLSQQEQEKLSKINEKLTENQRQEIIQQNEELVRLQDEKEDLSCLPSLELQDLDYRVEKVNIETENIKGRKFHFVKQNVNGLSYLRIKIALKNPPPLFLHEFSSLLQSIFPKLGTSKRTKDEMHTLFNQYTTSLNVFTNSNSYKNDANKVSHSLVLEIGCIDRNTEKMFDLLKELLNDFQVNDSQQIQAIIKNISSDISNDLLSNSLSYAINLSAQNLRPHLLFQDPLQQAKKIINLEKKLEQLFDGFIQNLKATLQNLIGSSETEFIVHSNQNPNIFRTQIQSLITENPTSELETIKLDFKHKFPKLFYQLPMQVNYCIQSHKIEGFLDKNTPFLSICSQIMSNVVLHKEIREKGGAYGSGCRMADGVMNFFSYRDPNVNKTYGAYKMALSAIIEGKFDQDDIKDAKMSIYQKLDAIVTPQNKGLQQIYRGITQEEIEGYRRMILEANKKDILTSAENVLAPQLQNNQFAQCVFGSNLIDELDINKSEWEIQEAINSDLLM